MSLSRQKAGTIANGEKLEIKRDYYEQANEKQMNEE